MSSGVKMIFKCLLGTVLVIVLGMLLIEVFNITIISMQIRSMSKIAAYQACSLFTQETYKSDGPSTSDRAANMQSALDRDGNVYISGVFYNGDNTKEIYNNLYSTSNTNFMTVADKLKNSGYYNLKLLLNGIEQSGSIAIDHTIDWNSPEAAIRQNLENQKSNNYYNEMYTPVNIGIPYLDPEVVQRMYQWNLAQLFSNCNSENIRVNENGDQYVYYSGFRIYAQDSTINIPVEAYNTYNINNVAERNQLKNKTGYTIVPQGSSAIGIHVVNAKDVFDNVIPDNSLITTVDINYEISVGYEGVTPLKTLIQFIWNNEVNGLGGGDINGNEDFDTLQTDTIDSNSGAVIPSTGNLVFTLVH